MRRAVLTVCAAAALALVPTTASAFGLGSAVLVLGMPEEEARTFLSRHGTAVGLGVYPPSRSSEAFLRTLQRPTRPNPPLTIGVAVATSMRGSHAAVLAEAFVPGAQPTSIDEAIRAHLSVVVVSKADDAEAVARLAPRPIVVLGVGPRTPVLVGLAGMGSGGPGRVLTGIPRRTGVVTPADIDGQLLAYLGIDANPNDDIRVVGDQQMRMVERPDPFGHIDAVRARMERDASFGPGLSMTTAGTGIGLVVFGTLALMLRRRAVGAAFARAAAMTPAGYLGALFVPDERWYVRVAVLAAAVVLGLVLAFPNVRRTCGWMIVLTAFAVALLAILAAMRPDAEPALSLWGDPLTSWRFFGLRNHLAGFVAGGLIVGLSLLSTSWWVFALAAGAGAFVVGAPTVGANFVGVLTLAFGAAVALLGRIGGRVRLVHIPVAAVTGAGAMLLALLADAGSPVSHGGRAVQTVRADGLDAAWEIFRRRAALNYDEINEIGLVAVIGFALAAFAISMLFAWAWRSSEAPPWLRAGVAGGAAAALAALLVEDSGFLAGSQLGLFPWIGWFAFELDDLRARRAPQPTPARPPEPSLPSGDG